MVSASRNKRFATVISILLLAALFLIGVGIFIKQFHYEMGRFGILTAALPLARQEAQTNEAEKMALSSLSPVGFGPLSEIQRYTSENLYEKINGKAPLYIESGFEELFTQRFADKSDETLAMELYVYDMGNVRNAFSVYSVQKRAEGQTLPNMHFGYKAGNAMYFVHGKYYVELVGYSVSQELFEAMTETAEKLRTSPVVDRDAGIVELSVFPRKNFVPGSVKLYLTSALGFAGLTDTFTARYGIDGETVTVFLSRRIDAGDAHNVAESYRRFLIANGGAARKSIEKNLEGKVYDFYGTIEIVTSIDNFVVGVHEAENQQAAEKLVKRLSEAVGND